MVTPPVRAAIAASLLLGLVQLGLADAPPVVPQPLTLCQLAAHPDRYDGVLILTQARVETDAIEHTWALDEDCKDDGGVEVLFTPTPATLNHVQEFRDAVTRAHHASREPHYKVVLAQLVGTYHRKQPREFISSLAVSDATSIRIVERPLLNPAPPKPRR